MKKYRNVILSSLWLALWAISPAHALTHLKGEGLVSKRTVSLPLKGEKRTVVVFLSANCPCSKSHEPVIKTLAEAFPEFRFVGIVSNKEETRPMLAAHFSKAQFPFPVLKDENFRFANHFRALKTPHAFILGKKGNVLYQGGIDDCHQAEGAKRHYLRRALTEIKTNGKPKRAYVRVLGCIIKR